MILPPGALGAIRGLAEVAAKTAATVCATPYETENYCPSFLIPRGFFEREIIETLEVVCCVRRKAVSSELVRIDLSVDDASISDIRQAFRSQAAEFIKGLGCIFDDIPEGIVILRSNRDAVENGHVDASAHVTGQHSSGMLSDGDQYGDGTATSLAGGARNIITRTTP
jgi:hypothetical protein